MSQKAYNADNVYAIPTRKMTEWCLAQKTRQEKVAELRLLRKFEKNIFKGKTKK